MRVKVNKEWTPIIKQDLMTKLENCTRDEFESSANDFYVGCSKTRNRKRKKKGPI